MREISFLLGHKVGAVRCSALQLLKTQRVPRCVGNAVGTQYVRQAALGPGGQDVVRARRT